MTNNKVLKVNNLSVDLNQENIIEDLSFDANKGQVITVLGPNGAGKTVLLKALLGVLPYKGQVIWKEGIKKSYVPTKVYLDSITPITVKEFFELKTEFSKEVSNLLRWVGISASENFLEKRIDHISSGEFQRLLVAWGLVENPEVILFDEPTFGVDIGGQKSIYHLLKELKEEKGVTILMVTHDLNVVYNFTDYVICLSKRIYCQGHPRKVLTPEQLAELYGGEVKFYQHT